MSRINFISLFVLFVLFVAKNLVPDSRYFALFRGFARLIFTENVCFFTGVKL